MVMDSEDGIWTARYGGSTLLKLSPHTGTLEGELRFPVPAVSSVAFGGPALDTLYVTTAGGKPDDPESVAGTLYRVQVPVRGRLDIGRASACELEKRAARSFALHACYPNPTRRRAQPLHGCRSWRPELDRQGRRQAT